ncbi:MAG TPA: DeoR/GlpR family DNA-binding transcription regulator, partial [Alphaproteobacteria bacterium]|nr:DeoR/GlpR family DNA-binding transcription regulator [Alphaproteobacteria bacterium]
MHERERHKLILKVLAERGMAMVRDLTDLLGASEPTVRRDINRLAEMDLLRKVRGGAEAISAGAPHGIAGRPFQVSQTINVEKKRRIAQKAVSLCRDGESIIINGGTTTYMMVEFLARRQLQILTNSFVMAQRLLAESNNRIILPGGEVYREQSIVLSPFDNDTTQSHYASKMFMGAQGLAPLGLMEVDPLLIRAEQKLINQAEQLIVLVDSSKFRQRASLILCPLERIHTVVTDDGVDPA